ncbi:MAG TPA: MoaD/ThiS family protein [Candidatus Polarisedimenticolia bacterium]|jgi:molybdopterin converting factor small subunit|nr:MoaD/ThiS family protein [Candidatus Polarisedimenticolia bacterium]
MKVRVLLFARLKELAGTGSLEVELPEKATLADVWRAVQSMAAGLGAVRPPPLMVRDLEYAPPDTPLSGGEEVAFLPPVSGG